MTIAFEGLMVDEVVAARARAIRRRGRRTSVTAGDVPTSSGRLPADVRRSTVVGRYLDWLQSGARPASSPTYAELWQWSVDDLDGFWSSIWSFFDVRSLDARTTRCSRHPAMPGTEWFPGARLNYAERALATDGRRDRGHRPLPVRATSVELTWDELRDQVARCRAGLGRLGVAPGRPGRRPTCPTAPRRWWPSWPRPASGAVWASCPPEFGARSVIDRFGQLDPVVLLVVRGYRYGDQVSRPVRRGAMPSSTHCPRVRAVVDVDTGWDDLLAEPAELAFDPVPFDHPLYVLFSSGHHRSAEGHRPRPRRDPARAPQGARPPPRPRARATGSSGSRPPAG